MLTCWSSHCSSGNTPHSKCRRKPWLQHDALSLYRHSLSSLYSVTIDRYKNETRKKCAHQYPMNWRSHHSVPDKHSSQWAGEKPGCSVMTYYGHLTSLDRWLTDIVNSTYSTMLNTEIDSANWVNSYLGLYFLKHRQFRWTNLCVSVLCFGLRLTLLTQGVRVHLNEVKRAER
jgi:hypothetical protein